MKIWIDAQLSPALATWLEQEFEVEATAVRDMGLERAKDPEIFGAAGREDAVVMTKDSDSVRMLERNGPPAQVLWITCGNTSNQALQRILGSTFDDALNLLREGNSMGNRVPTPSFAVAVAQLRFGDGQQAFPVETPGAILTLRYYPYLRDAALTRFAWD